MQHNVKGKKGKFKDFSCVLFARLKRLFKYFSWDLISLVSCGVEGQNMYVCMYVGYSISILTVPEASQDH